jgi:hypothetical protein
MVEIYKDRKSTVIIRKVKSLESISMDKSGIRIKRYEDSQTLDELLMEKFYESEFDIKIKGRQYGKDAGVFIEIEYW